MAKDVIMPVLGMNQDTAVLLGWLKREGDRVEKGEPIMEVETDKATMELDAPASGTLSGVRAAAGDEVKVGSVIAVILADGEVPADGTRRDATRPDAGAVTPGAPPRAPEAAAAGDSPAREAPASPAPAATRRTPAGARAVPGAAVAVGAVGGIVPASPKARRLAGEHGVPLEALRGRGHGPQGAVLAADVLEAARSAARAAAAEAAPTGTAAALRFERLVEAGPLEAAAARARAHLGGAAAGITVGDLLVRFLAAVWAWQPLDGSDAAGSVRYRRVAEGTVTDAVLTVAAAADLTAVAQARLDAHRSDSAAAPAPVSLLDLSACRADLAAGALPAGGTVLAVVAGRLEERVVAHGGAPIVTRALRLTLAFDPSRVDDGRAAAWSDRLVALVEEPAALALLY